MHMLFCWAAHAYVLYLCAVVMSSELYRVVIYLDSLVITSSDQQLAICREVDTSYSAGVSFED